MNLTQLLEEQKKEARENHVVSGYPDFRGVSMSVTDLDTLVTTAITKGYELALEEVENTVTSKRIGSRPTFETGDPQWWDECAEGYNQALEVVLEFIVKIKQSK